MTRLNQKNSAVNFILYLFLFVFIVGGNALTFNLFGRVAVKLSELAGIAAGIFLCRYFLRVKMDRAVLMILWWALLSCALIFLNTLQYGFGAGDVVTAVLYLFRFVYFLLLAYMSAVYFNRTNQRLAVLNAVNVLYLLVSLIGFFQLIFYPAAYDFYEIFYRIGVYFPDPDPHINRLVSTYFDPNYCACCLLIGLTADLSLLQKSYTEKNKKFYVYLVCAAIYLAAILLTKSRSGFLGCVILLAFSIVLSYNYKKIKIWHFAVLVAVLTVGTCLLLFSDISVFVRIREVFSDPSAEFRLQSWQKGLGVVVDTNFLGTGYNLFGSFNQAFYGAEAESNLYGNDSSLLLVLMTTGVIGFLLFAAHIFILFKDKRTVPLLKSLIIAALIVCNFNNLLFYSLWVFPFYFLIYLQVKQPQTIERPENTKLHLRKEQWTYPS